MLSNEKISNVPESYIEYYNSHPETFCAEETIELEAETALFLANESTRLGISQNLYINYILLKFIIAEKMKTETEFGFGMLSHDFQLYSEDEFSDLIKESKKILIFDEKADKTAVILSADEYKKISPSLPDLIVEHVEKKE